MDAARRFSLMATTGLLGIAVMLGWVSTRPVMSASAASELARASAYWDSTIVLARNARPVGARGDALTVGLGYLERLRLGLDDPFFLVDGALHDSRLDVTMQTRVAWALLDRLRRGDAYMIDATALDGIGPWGHDGHGATGAAHLALIERAIERASDPRAGELTVRLAYLIEAGKGRLGPASTTIATEVAALVRDRELARADLRDLLADANERHADPMALIADRRAARSLRVEQPPLAPLDSNLQIEAMDAVPALVNALDTLDRVVELPSGHGASAPVLGERFARRLAELGAAQPPLAPVVVTMRGYPHASLDATNDETLAAAYTPFAFAPDSARRVANIGLLAGAVALRTRAQDTPWFTGDGGPDVRDLTAEFGLADVKFAHGIEPAWRPYYLGELQRALRDMQRVYPAFSFDGLRVAFGTSGLPDSALAMHDPRTRTLELSIATSGGTLAHELSHDLDWQTARRMFANAGGYSTDHAVQAQRGAAGGGGVLAKSVRGLAVARMIRPGYAGPTSDRPAELFARGSDWFTASVLASEGRTNGFLTAVQDASLPGYAAGAPTAVGIAGVESLTAAIDQMTFISDTARGVFNAQWADAETIDPVVLVRRVMETPVSWRMLWHRETPATEPAALLPQAKTSLCVASASNEAKARERLLMLAIEARARSAAWRRARYRSFSMRRETAGAILGVAPWNTAGADGVVEALQSAIVGELSSSEANQGLVPVVPAIFRSSSTSCSSISR